MSIITQGWAYVSGSRFVPEGGAGSIQFANSAGEFSGSTLLTTDQSGSITGSLVSASYFYGDGSGLTGLTASAVAVADGPEMSVQFRYDSPIGREISGSSDFMWITGSASADYLQVTGAVRVAGALTASTVTTSDLIGGSPLVVSASNITITALTSSLSGNVVISASTNTDIFRVEAAGHQKAILLDSNGGDAFLKFNDNNGPITTTLGTYGVGEGIKLNDTGVLINCDANENCDFRVETKNHDYALFVDAGTDHVVFFSGSGGGHAVVSGALEVSADHGSGLHITGSASGSLLDITSDAVGDATKSILFVSGSGEIGMGTLVPNHTLTISGSVSASTDVSASAFYFGPGGRQQITDTSTDFSLLATSTPMAIGADGGNVVVQGGFNFSGNNLSCSNPSGVGLPITASAYYGARLEHTGKLTLTASKNIGIDADGGVVAFADGGAQKLLLYMNDSAAPALFDSVGGDIAFRPNSAAGGGRVAVTGSLSASINISASAFYGDGSNLSNITSDKIDTTLKTDNSDYYLPFVDSAVASTGIDLNIKDAVKLHPGSGSLILSGTGDLSQSVSLFGGGMTRYDSYASRLKFTGAGYGIQENTAPHMVAIAQSLTSAAGFFPGFKYQNELRVHAGDGNPNGGNIKLTGSGFITIDFSNTNTLGGSEFNFRSLDTYIRQTSGSPYVIGDGSNGFLIMNLDDRSWYFNRVAGTLEKFSAGQLTCSFGPTTINSNYAGTTGLLINGDENDLEVALQVNNSHAQFNAGLTASAILSNGDSQFNAALTASGIQANGDSQFNANLTASYILCNGAAQFNSGLTVSGITQLNGILTASSPARFDSNVNLYGNLSSSAIVWQIHSGSNATGSGPLQNGGLVIFSSGSESGTQDYLKFHTSGTAPGVVMANNVYMNNVGDNEEQPAQFLSFYVSSSNNGYVTRTTGQQVFNQAVSSSTSTGLTASNGQLSVQIIGTKTGGIALSGSTADPDGSGIFLSGSDLVEGAFDHGSWYNSTIIFSDVNDTSHDGMKKITMADVATKLAGANLTATNGVLAAAGGGGGGGGIFTEINATQAATTSSVSVGKSGAPNGILEVSGSQETSGTPLFRVTGDYPDGVTAAGPPEPIFFVTGSGRIGIGTDSPSRLLEISGSDSVLMKFTSQAHRAYSVGSDGYGFMIFDDSQGGTPGYRLVISDTADRLGYTGIGAGLISPSARLHVSSSQDANSYGVLRIDGDGNGSDPGTDGTGILFVTGSGRVGVGNIAPTDKLHISGSGEAGGVGLLRVSGDLSSSVLFVTGSNRVGIGTDTPRRLFEVSGTVADASLLVASDSKAIELLPASGPAMSFGLPDDTDYYMKIGAFGGKNQIYLNNASTDFQISGSAGGIGYYLDQSEQLVGIGTTTPAAALHVSASVHDEGVEGDLFCVSGETNGVILFVSGSGRVGIGTNDPECQLDVRMEPSNNGDQFRLGNASNYYKMGRGADGFFQIQGTQTNYTGYTFKDSAGNGVVTIEAENDKLAVTGSIMPGDDNTHDLGSSAMRWANVYTGDLHLANDRGNWTVVEESDYLTIRNNKTGKRFKLLMEEID
jgi:hypothetical protein